jgi:hypothetical protein
MRLRILDIDGSITAQKGLLAGHDADIFPAGSWGPDIRLACAWSNFRRFQTEFSGWMGRFDREEPAITLYGSGDFHHLSLALVALQRRPINLLVLDKHPDWMRGVPFLHCGTWLYHGARLPHVEKVFHIGGDLDFDNYYRWMAPWDMLRSGKIVVIPAIRSFKGGGWKMIRHEPLRAGLRGTLDRDSLCRQLDPYRSDLAARPLYVSLDKDVMPEVEAIVNWDSGYLRLAEVERVLETFIGHAGGRLAGMDITGDWSPVRLRGWLRHFMHWTEHPALHIEALEARRQNEALNLRLIETVERCRATGEVRKTA